MNKNLYCLHIWSNMAFLGLSREKISLFNVRGPKWQGPENKSKIKVGQIKLNLKNIIVYSKTIFLCNRLKPHSVKSNGFYWFNYVL